MLNVPLLLASFALLVLSLSCHEAAHAWTADRLGDPTPRLLGRLTLNPLAHIDWIGTVLFPLLSLFSPVPLLGWAKPVPVNARNLRAPRRDFAIVAAAGPITNLLLATLAAVLVRLTGAGLSGGGWTGLVLRGAVQINVFLAVFNMIPVPPLDGGNVAIGLLPGPAARVIAMLRPYGFLVLYALMLTGVLWTIIGPIADAILRELL